MKKWTTYEITTKFDNSVVQISWDGITRADAIREVKDLAKRNNKELNEYIITQLPRNNGYSDEALERARKGIFGG
tara:strand:+ start:2811 stop:3035 length:225 start_codon:yes stop_codon:yes gene_type:complete